MTEIKKENPQRMLSKSLLVHALLELMEERPYNEINITDLSKKADLSRRTFYRHFATIDEVLDYVLIQISKQFSVYQAQQRPRTLKEIAFTFFSYWQQHRQFLQVLKNNNLLYRLHNKFAIISSNAKEEKAPVYTDVSLIDYAISFTSGALWNLLVKWLDNGAVQSPKEMSDIVECVLKHLTQ